MTDDPWPIQFQAILEAAPDAMVITNGHGRIVLVNAEAERQFGYTRGEMLGQGLELLVPDRFKNLHASQREGYFHAPRTRPMGAAGMELFGLRKNGEEFPAEISLSPLETEGGSLVISAIRDISKRRQAEAELERAYQHAKELEALKTRFFANISHELRTPLALILGPLGRTTQEDNLTPSQRYDLQVVQRNAQVLLKQVNDLLDVAKLDAGKMPVSYSRLNLSRLIRTVAGNFDALAVDRQLVFEVEAPGELWLEGDPDKLERVIFNLLANAFKYTPSGGRIQIRAEACDPEGVRVSVQDTGPGVADSLKPIIFDRFQQGETGCDREFGGTGLGLAIAKDMVALHQGALGVQDAPGGGALFTFTLPGHAPPGTPIQQEPTLAIAGHPLPPMAVPPTPSEPDHRTHLPLALVVEDNPELNRFIAEALCPHFRIATAFDGQEGLEKTHALLPDIVVTDIMMPRMSGDRLLEALRQEPSLAGVPVLVLSAKADDSLKVKLLSEGCQDYIIKPFLPQELVARVRNLVTTKRARDILQNEVDRQVQDLDTLAVEVSLRKRQLEIALSQVEVARDEAQRASHMKGHLINLLSHELRTPLSSLQLQVDLLDRNHEQLPAPAQVCLRRIGRSTQRLTQLIASILEYARISGGRLNLQLAAFDLGALASDVWREHLPEAQQKKLELSRQIAPDLPLLVSDPNLIRLVMVNLVTNAIKYTHHGSIRLFVGFDGQCHLISVVDTGMGIPEDQQALVFEPFTQVEDLRNKHIPGVGLGLAIVKVLVEALDGTLELESRVGHGTTFSVHLPALVPAPH